MKIGTSTKEPFEKVHIKEGLYPAKFIGANDEVKEGKFGKRIALIFEIQGLADDKGNKIQLAFIVSDKPATKNNKLGECLVAFGEEIDGKEKDLDNYVGKMVNVLVEDYKYISKDRTGKEESKTASIITKIKSV